MDRSSVKRGLVAVITGAIATAVLLLAVPTGSAGAGGHEPAGGPGQTGSHSKHTSRSHGSKKRKAKRSCRRKRGKSSRHVRWVVVVYDPGGKRPPTHPRSTRCMKLRYSGKSRRKQAGKDVKFTARTFRPGEYVSVWDFYRSKRQVSSLQGRFANKKGTLRFTISTFAGSTKNGKHTICAKGERSKRVACGSYTQFGGGIEQDPYESPQSDGGGTGDGSGGGYTPPQSDGDYKPPTSG